MNISGIFIFLDFITLVEADMWGPWSMDRIHELGSMEQCTVWWGPHVRGRLMVD